MLLLRTLSALVRYTGKSLLTVIVVDLTIVDTPCFAVHSASCTLAELCS